MEPVLCPYCKHPVDVYLTHPLEPGYWMARCVKCDVWPVIPMQDADGKNGKK